MLRMASAMTALAASVLVGPLLLRPADPPSVESSASSQTVPWEAVALMPPAVVLADADGGDELVQLAQWMADDLAIEGQQ